MKSRLFLTLLFILSISPLAFSQSYALSPEPKIQFFNASGIPIAAGKVCTFAAGTTTPLATYSDNAGTPNANPIILDAAGRATIYLGAASYKFAARTVGTDGTGVGATCPGGAGAGTTVYTQDNVSNLAQMQTLIFATQLDDKVCHASQYTGATAGVKVAACITALPSTGGTIDARGLEGAQSISADPFTGVTKPITLVWGAGTWSSAVSLTIPANVTIDFPQGGILSMAVSTTSTINGEIRGTQSQHFAGSGNIVFGAANATSSISPLWFGVRCDGTTDDAGALNKLTNTGTALNNGGTVLFPSGATCRTTSATWYISKSNVTIDFNNSELLYQPAVIATGNDRAMAVHSGDANIQNPLVNITAPIVVGATVFAAANTTGLAAGDWLIIQETDPGEGGDALLFDWMQVASVSGANVTTYTPFRTAFPSTHSTPQFAKISNVTKNVTIKNGRCRTTNAVTNLPCFVGGVARGVTFENLISAPALGNPLVTYRTQGVSVINFRQTTNAGQATEFSTTVDLNIIGSQFTCDGASPTSSALVLDFATAFFSVVGNQISCGANLMMQMTGTHDGTITGNTLGYVRDAGIGNTQAISAQGAQRHVYSGNFLVGGAGGASTGISLGNSLTWTSNINSAGNWVANNSVMGFATAVLVTTSDVAITQPINGSAQIRNGVMLGNLPASTDTLLRITSPTQSLLPIHWERSGVNNWYAGPDVATGANFSINFNSATAGSFVIDQAGTASTLGDLIIGTTATASTPIKHHWSAQASLDFAAWAGADCQDLTITVTGSATQDTVEIGVDATLASTAGVQFTGFVSAANTVTVRGCKVTAGASANPAAQVVRADVWRH